MSRAERDALHMQAIKEDVGEQDCHAQASAVGGLVGDCHEARRLGLLLGCHQLGGCDEGARVQVATCHPGDDHICCKQAGKQ